MSELAFQIAGTAFTLSLNAAGVICSRAAYRIAARTGHTLIGRLMLMQPILLRVERELAQWAATDDPHADEARRLQRALRWAAWSIAVTTPLFFVTALVRSL